jgi:ribosomal protein S28E/S33
MISRTREVSKLPRKRLDISGGSNAAIAQIKIKLLGAQPYAGKRQLGRKLFQQVSDEGPVRLADIAVFLMLLLLRPVFDCPASRPEILLRT